MKDLILKAQAGDRDAEYEIIKNNDGLIRHKMKQFGVPTYDEDMHSVGVTSMIRAIRKYAVNGDVKFSTYASVVIERGIMNFIVKQNNHKNRCLTEAISFESKVPNSDNATVGDFVADKFKTEDYSITFLDLQVALDSLPYIERKMFEMTYIDLLSQKEVIDTLGLNCSQSYVSRQLVKIKNKLANKMSVSCN